MNVANEATLLAEAAERDYLDSMLIAERKWKQWAKLVVVANVRPAAEGECQT